VNLVSIEGKYEILGKLREGGMGAVYKVRHRLLDEIRVIKVIRPHLVASPELSDRFLREARLAIQLRHPNIAQLHDFSVDEDGSAFIVLEFIDGATFEDLLKATGPPPLGLGLETAQQSLRALGYLHRKGFLHRDIAADNLMLTRDVDGRPLVKLIDLGIAKVLTGGGAGLTMTGMFLGKPRYASPEQFEGRGEAGMDARSDLYSLGVVLYELLTGMHPIVGSDPSSFMAGHMFRPPIDFSVSDPEGRLPGDLREVLLRVLAKKPEERFASAEELSQRLAAVQARLPAEAIDLEGLLLRAAREAEAAGGRPGSTQDRLDRRFAKEATPPPAEPTVRLERAEKAAPVNLDATQVLRPRELGLPAPVAPPRREEAPDLEETGVLRDPHPLAPSPTRTHTRPGEGGKSLASSASFGAAAPLSRAGVSAGGRGDGGEGSRLWPLAVAGLAALLLAVGLGWWLLRSREQPEVVPEASPTPVVAQTPALVASPSPPMVSDPVIEESSPEPVAPEPSPTPPPPVPTPQPEPPRAQPKATPALPKVTPAPKVPSKPRKPVDVTVDEPAEKPSRREEPAMRKGDLIMAGPGVEDTQLTTAPALIYPETLEGTGTYAMVSVAVLVDENGAVVDAKVKGAFVDGSGGAEFRKAALEAARKARFRPATKNGVPGKMWGELTFEFGTKKP
jgi:serine/threonine-protein kinase